MNELVEEDPSGSALEKNIASLENGRYGLIFSTGLTACWVITKLLRPGDHILVSEDMYGGSYYLIESVMAQYKVKVHYANTANLSEVKNAISRRTKLIWLDTPSNPSLKLADLSAIANLAKEHKIITVVDNSIATPWFQKPLELGADIVVHSTIKYISGRNDIIAGAIVANRIDLFEELKLHREAMNDSMEPIDCFGILKGMRTLSTRMQRQERSAKRIANFLSRHPSVQVVYYPGLPSHPQHELARKQMSGFGSMLAFELKGGTEAATKLIQAGQKFALYEKMMDAKSIVAESTTCSTIVHAKLPEQVLANNNYQGLGSVVRINVGTEDTDTLIADLSTALRVVDHQLIEFPATTDLRECI